MRNWPPNRGPGKVTAVAPAPSATTAPESRRRRRPGQRPVPGCVRDAVRTRHNLSPNRPDASAARTRLSARTQLGRNANLPRRALTQRTHQIDTPHPQPPNPPEVPIHLGKEASSPPVPPVPSAAPGRSLTTALQGNAALTASSCARLRGPSNGCLERRHVPVFYFGFAAERSERSSAGRHRARNAASPAGLAARQFVAGQSAAPAEGGRCGRTPPTPRDRCSKALGSRSLRPFAVGVPGRLFRWVCKLGAG